MLSSKILICKNFKIWNVQIQGLFKHLQGPGTFSKIQGLSRTSQGPYEPCVKVMMWKANLLNEGTILGMDKGQSVQLLALTEQTIEVRVLEHWETLVRHVRKKWVHSWHPQHQQSRTSTWGLSMETSLSDMRCSQLDNTVTLYRTQLVLRWMTTLKVKLKV